MKKKLLPPILIIIFAFSGYTRIEGNEDIKAIQFVSILAIGIGIGVLIKTLLEIYGQKK